MAMDDFKFFSHDDDERSVDETPLALHLLAMPQDLDPELSLWEMVLCSMGDILAATMLIATLKTLWGWFVWSHLLLLVLQLILSIGVWIVLFAFCTVKLIADQQHKHKNRCLRQQRQSFQQAWFDELLQAKRDARLRKNKALDTELVLRQTRLPANEQGNRDALYDPHTGRVLLVSSGNFVQPVPHTFHYHHAVPEVKGIEDKADQLPAPQFPPPRDFADILQWFRPSVHEVYLAETIREPLTSKVYDLCHVGVGGPTGGGKTNATRLIIAQLLSHDVQATVYLATPNFSQVKLNGHRIEDWRPIVRRLAEPPAVEKEEIADLLHRFLQLFEQRRRIERQTLRRQRDIFLVLGEWPAIVARVKEAPDVLTLLLREARQYGVHVITEMQDALVKTIGLSSGARENLRTGLYYGGDLNTAKVLLNLKAGQSVNEQGLGQKGAVYVRTSTNPPVPGRVPLLSNRALYLLLGTPPDPMPDGEMDDESPIPETYEQVDEHGRYVDGGGVLKIHAHEEAADSSRTPTHSSVSTRAGPSPNPARTVESTADPAPGDCGAGPLANPMNGLAEGAGRSPHAVPAAASVRDGPERGPGDKLFTPEQEQEFVRRYQRNSQQGVKDIKTTLRQMNHGQGLGNSYFKHASWLVKRYGLREA